MSPFIPYSRQSIDEDDIAAVVDVLRSDWLTSGPRVSEFEAALAAQCGAQHAVAVSSGTAALHLSMIAGKVGPGDTVLTSPNTFVATANCAEVVGATVDFVDIDAATANLDPAALERQPFDNVSAVVAVDFAGQPCDMPRIASIARAHGALVIEDASHSLGSQIYDDGQWYSTGGHGWADMTVFSFHPIKNVTCGEGGAILTHDADIAHRCRQFRNHALVKDPASFVGLVAERDDVSAELRACGSWYYELHEVGCNYRITDIQCALGLSQLSKLPRFLTRRHEIVATYNEAFAAIPHVRPLMAADNVRPAWHLYVLQIDFEELGKSRQEVINEFRERGIGTQVHYIPVHLQPYYRRKYGFSPGKCPVAEEYYAHCLSLPLFAELTDAQIAEVIRAVGDILTP